MKVTSDTTSGQLTRTSKKLVKNDEDDLELEKIKKHNLRLTGEVAILRQNLISIERENYALKAQKNNRLIRTLDKAESLKKELSLLQTENRIKDNQLRAYKRPISSINTQNQKENDLLDLNKEILDYRWVLKKISNEIVFSIFPFEIDRLEILHDYFLNEFENLLTKTDVIIEQLRINKKDMKVFIRFFYISSMKKEIFVSFFKDIFPMYFNFVDCKKQKDIFFVQNKIYDILNSIDVSWLMSFIEDKEFMINLNSFIDETMTNFNLLFFYKRISKERPFILGILLSKERFNLLLSHFIELDQKKYFDDFVDITPDEILKCYIDETNIDKIEPKNLERVFKSEYM